MNSTPWSVREQAPSGGRWTRATCSSPPSPRSSCTSSARPRSTEYRKNVEKDAAAALARRFQLVLVPNRPWTTPSPSPCAGCATATSPPAGALRRRGAGGRRRTVRPVHHRPVPAPQGHRPHRPGGARVRCEPTPQPGRAGAGAELAEELQRDRTRPSPASSTSARPRCVTPDLPAPGEIEQPTATTARPRRQVPRRSPWKTSPRSSAATASRSASSPRRRRTGCSRLEGHLHERVIGSGRRGRGCRRGHFRALRAGLADPDRPMGSFLFLGPTGLRQTELARALTEAFVRRGEPDRSGGHERVPGQAHGEPAGRRAARYVGTRKPASSPRRSGGGPTPSSCSTRSRRPMSLTIWPE